MVPVLSKMVPAERRREICALLGVRQVNRHEKYLGIPTIVGRSKKAIFSTLKERIWKKLQGWKEKLMSKPGKEILIKAVAQAIPTYLMGIFKIPDGLLDEIHTILARFWWGNGDQDKMHWKSWTSLCLPKAKGGMGFRDLKIFNQALLAKQGWRLMKATESLLSQVLKAKYFKNSDFLGARRGFDPSYTWRSIWGAKSLLLEGLQWRVGDGNDISVWRDKWVPQAFTFNNPIPPANGLHDEDIRVADLMNEDKTEWNLREMNLHLREEDIDRILNIPLISDSGKDTQYWGLTVDGCYTVKSGYWLGVLGHNAEHIDQTEAAWKLIWKLNCPPKIKHFLWRACTKTLSVSAELHRRHIIESNNCQRCGGEEESIYHAIFECQDAQIIWVGSEFSATIQEANSTDFLELLLWISEKLSQQELITFIALCWASWTSRNKSLFDDERHDAKQLAVGFVNYTRDYQTYAAKVLNRANIRQYGSISQWLTPPSGVMKVNTDAAILSTGVVGLGAVIRDCDGRLITSGTRRIKGNWDPGIAEAAAMAYGLELAKRFGYNNVWLESDSLGSVQRVHSKLKGYSYLFMFINRIICLGESFNSFVCSHVKRGGNTVAHWVARSEVSINSEIVRFAPFPESFQKLADMDID